MTPIEALQQLIAQTVRDELAKMHTQPPDEYLSTADAAQIARVTTGTIRRWVRDRELTKHGKGARVRIRRDELEQYLSGAGEAGPEDRAKRRFG